MKRFLFCLLIMVGCQGGKNINQKDTAMINGNEIERFDYSLLPEEVRKKGRGCTGWLKDGWKVSISLYSEGNITQWEYAPAKDFYMIVKSYHSNGILKSYCQYLGHVPFGIRRVYDTDGNLIERVDEDAKFGNLKPQDIVDFIERQGLINRETGSVLFNRPRYASDTIRKTDGTFYISVIYRYHLEIFFSPANHSEDGKEIKPPRWSISYIKDPDKEIEYLVDGNTGKYEIYESEYISTE